VTPAGFEPAPPP